MLSADLPEFAPVTIAVFPTRHAELLVIPQVNRFIIYNINKKSERKMIQFSNIVYQGSTNTILVLFVIYIYLYLIKDSSAIMFTNAQQLVLFSFNLYKIIGNCCRDKLQNT